MAPDFPEHPVGQLSEKASKRTQLRFESFPKENRDFKRNTTFVWVELCHGLVYSRRKAPQNACFPHKHQNGTHLRMG